MLSNDEPSLTALTAAAARAAHLIVDSDPLILKDNLAAALLGEQADDLIGYHRAHGAHPVLSGTRAQVTTRSRYTEDHLARCVARGIRQYVILGAGLDSFAYRSPLASEVAVFEVDHPATQQWKRRGLSAGGIAVPPCVSFVAADMENDSLADNLAKAGFDLARPALVSWLGVTMYLTPAAIGRVLTEIGCFAPGSELIADYMLPAHLRDAAGNAYADLVMPVTAERGEPWLTFLTPAQMSALLKKHGMEPAGHVSQREAVDGALWERTDSLRPMTVSLLARAALRGPRDG
ncbi:MAG: class I SAM-dependent methyltransferase [Micromonosporaceae bacterium]